MLYLTLNRLNLNRPKNSLYCKENSIVHELDIDQTKAGPSLDIKENGMQAIMKRERIPFPAPLFPKYVFELVEVQGKPESWGFAGSAEQNWNPVNTGKYL